MKKLFLAIAAFASVLTLAACGDGGGGGDDRAVVVQQDLTVPVNATNGKTVTTALAAEPFTFSAVESFGTTTTTTLTFTAPTTSTGPTGFNVAAGGSTATGTMDFGSCIFNVVTSSFPVGHRLASGGRVVVSICQLFLDIGGAPADNIGRQRGAIVILDRSQSASRLVLTVITPSGNVIINNVPAADAPVTPVTGA